MYGTPARAFAGLAAKHGVPVFFYYFTRVGEGSRDPGAFHGSQAAFFLGQSMVPPSLGRTPYDTMLTRTMSEYLVAFATTGDANGSGRPQWPMYVPGSERYLALGREVVAKRDLRKSEWDAIDRVARSRGAIRP
jgi:para-nitrobenzyl esterase